MDEQSPMPETPWWSAPGATTVLPPEAPAAPASPEPAPRAPRPRKNATALLVALALVAGGGVGGGVAHLLGDDSTTVVAGTPLSSGTIKGEATPAIAGTPESAAAIIAPSVVTVEVTGASSDGFGPSRASTGSGVVLRADGFIVTNNHVVDAAVGGGSVHVTLTNGTTIPASIVGTDPSTDLAVIRVKNVSGLKAAVFAKSSELKVGQAVLAVGAPLGLSNTVTQGIVSTLNRPLRTGDNQQAVLDAVQTDAAINPGNSGGALVDLAGRVVGINSAIATSGGTSGNIGVGFAIPSEVAVKVSDEIIATGRATHSQIGISVADAPSGTDGAPGLGAVVRSVVSGGPAEKAGLQVGDVITKVGDRRVTDADSLIVAIRANAPGTTVSVTVTRDGAQKILEATLGSATS